MNSLNGTIHSIKHTGDIIWIEVAIKEDFIHILALDPLSSIKHHEPITLIFKEHSVFLASIDSCLASENVYRSPISHIIKGDMLWQVFLDFKGDMISSILTTQAAKKLDLKDQQDLLWCVNPHEITLKG